MTKKVSFNICVREGVKEPESAAAILSSAGLDDGEVQLIVQKGMSLQGILDLIQAEGPGVWALIRRVLDYITPPTPPDPAPPAAQAK